MTSSVVYNEDCMVGMARYPDKYFDLAIVDPPYGIEEKISVGGGSHTKNSCKFHQLYSENGKSWDKKVDKNYFEELFRVSSNQIIWGANYYEMPPCRGFIVWDKVRFVENFSTIEFAWTSFDCHAKKFEFCNNGGFVLREEDKKIHPTQKPIALYNWLIDNYAKDCKNILDTHVGSGSSRIAASKADIDFVGFEIDKEYWEAQEKRFERFIAQGRLF